MNTAKSQNASHIATQVVIMQSGQTYYADKVEKDGAYLRITNKDGAISKVLKSNSSFGVDGQTTKKEAQQPKIITY